MPVKSDPWKRPKNDKWIKVGKRIVQHKDGSDPRQAPVFVITKIEATGNGAKMVHLSLEADPTLTTAKWATDLCGGTFLSGLSGFWIPVPPPPKPPRPKKERTTRFDREDPV
jgi:hypothetical protein